MGFSGTKSLKYASNWEECNRLLETAKPRGTKWEDNERPLGNNRAHHYRVVQGEDFFDVVLYSTTMARFYEPQGDTRRVQYCWDSRKTSTSFMWDVCRVGWWTSYGEIMVPIGAAGCLEDCDLYFNEGKLDIAMSNHRQLYRAVSSPRDKEKRKEIRVAIAPLLDVACMRMAELMECGEFKMPYSTAFEGVGLEWDHQQALRGFANGWVSEAKPAAYEKFFEACQKILESLVRKRAFALRHPSGSIWGIRNREQSAEQCIEKAKASVTTKDFRKSLEGALIRAVSADNRTGKEPLPKWIKKEDIPKNITL